MPQFVNYFRKTQRFYPGKFRFGLNPIRFSLFEEESSSVLSDLDALLILCLFASAVDEEVVDVELLASFQIVLLWPIFASLGDYENRGAFMDRCLDVFVKSEPVELAENAFGCVSSSKRPITYAALVEVVYADQKIRDREIEFLELAKSRLNISEALDRTLQSSAQVRFSV